MKNLPVSEIEKFIKSHFSKESEITIQYFEEDRPEIYVLVDNYSDFEVLTDEAKIEFEQFFEAEFVDANIFVSDSEGSPRIYSLEVSIS